MISTPPNTWFHQGLGSNKVLSRFQGPSGNPEWSLDTSEISWNSQLQNYIFAWTSDQFRCTWGHAHTWPPKVHGPKIPKPPRNCIFAKFGSLRARKDASKSIDLVSKKSHVARNTSLHYFCNVSELSTTTLGPVWDPKRVPEANI